MRHFNTYREAAAYYKNLSRHHQPFSQNLKLTTKGETLYWFVAYPDGGGEEFSSPICDEQE